MRISDWSSDVCSSDLRSMPEKRSCQEASIRPVYRRRPHAIVPGAKQEPAMSTPPEASPAKPAKPSAASRYLFVFLVGLVLGAVALVLILRTLAAKNTCQATSPQSSMHPSHTPHP